MPLGFLTQVRKTSLALIVVPKKLTNTTATVPPHSLIQTTERRRSLQWQLYIPNCLQPLSCSLPPHPMQELYCLVLPCFQPSSLSYSTSLKSLGLTQVCKGQWFFEPGKCMIMDFLPKSTVDFASPALNTFISYCILKATIYMVRFTTQSHLHGKGRNVNRAVRNSYTTVYKTVVKFLLCSINTSVIKHTQQKISEI